MHSASDMASVYFRNTRSGKKGNKQPKLRHFKYNTPAIGPYAVQPSECVLSVLTTIASEAAGKDVRLDPDLREHVVLGSWSGSGASCIAFTRIPELVTAMISIRGCSRDTVDHAVGQVCSSNPGVNAPSVMEHAKEHVIDGKLVRHSVIQVSGRLAPHVVDALRVSGAPSFRHEVTFCNATQAKLCFCITLPSGTHIRTLSPGSLHLLSSSFPQWAGCISQPAAEYYKIICEPLQGCFRTSANKNSCCMLYADGRMRLQGIVEDCARTMAALRFALNTLMTGSRCTAFLSLLVEHPLSDTEEAGEGAPMSDTTSMRGSSRW